MDRKKLERRFEQEMHEVYRRVRKAYRPPSYLLEAIKGRGGFEVAITAMEKLHPSETSNTLCQMYHLDSSIETLVLRDPWRQLFERKHFSKAEKRSKKL